MANKQETVIVNFNEQKICIQEVTRYTTCDDVIEMLFYKSSKSGESDSYALFESSYGVERMLYGKESVLKVIRSWGSEKNNFTLVLREVDNIKSNMATLSQARRKLRKLKAQNAKLLPSAADNNTFQANLNNFNNKTVKDKEIDSLKKDVKEQYGKLGILKRFLSDVVLHKKKEMKEVPESRMPFRLPGDGCNTTLDHQHAKENELSTIDNDYLNKRSDNELNEVDVLRSYNSYLNAAFVEGDDDLLDSDMDRLSEHSSYEDESAFEEYSDSDSICELERNILELSDVGFEDTANVGSSDNEDRFSFCDTDNTVIKCERIRNIFSQVELNGLEIDNVDADMESFMNTLVLDSETDEGLSSLDSDTE